MLILGLLPDSSQDTSCPGPRAALEEGGWAGGVSSVWPWSSRWPPGASWAGAGPECPGRPQDRPRAPLLPGPWACHQVARRCPGCRAQPPLFRELSHPESNQPGPSQGPLREKPQVPGTDMRPRVQALARPHSPRDVGTHCGWRKEGRREVAEGGGGGAQRKGPWLGTESSRPPWITDQQGGPSGPGERRKGGPSMWSACRARGPVLCLLPNRSGRHHRPPCGSSVKSTTDQACGLGTWWGAVTCPGAGCLSSSLEFDQKQETEHFPRHPETHGVCRFCSRPCNTPNYTIKRVARMLGFPVHVQIMSTRYCSLLSGQWHYV